MSEQVVTVVGLGVIGGSLARALAQDGWRVRGVSPDASELAGAERESIVPFPLTEDGLRNAVAGAAIVVIAVPLGAMTRVAQRVVALATEALIIHAGSLQGESALGFPPDIRDRVIGAHPMAGSHESGYDASDPQLFRGCTVLAEDRATPTQRPRIEAMWRAVGALRILYADADEHDRTMAWTSHLPQITATALSATLSRAAAPPAFAGPGARDASRLALSPFQLWRSILLGAPPETRQAIAALEGTLRELREAIEQRDDDALEAVWQRGRSWRSAAAAQIT